jgi:hypothetical protein
MTYLSPYPPGCSPADIDNAWGGDGLTLAPDTTCPLICPSCDWQGDHLSDATWLQDPQHRGDWDAYCPDCGEKL